MIARIEAMRRALAFVNGPLGKQDSDDAATTLMVFDRELAALTAARGSTSDPAVVSSNIEEAKEQ